MRFLVFIGLESFFCKMVEIRFDEFVGDVTSSLVSGSFKVDRYAVNPGLTGTFPWASRLASSFLQYEFTGLEFMFVSTSGTALNSTDSNLGVMAMRFLYDPTEPTDLSYVNMVNSHGCYRGAPWKNMGVRVDLRNQVTNVLKVRVGGVPAGQDQRMFDVGAIEVASNGVQGAGIKLGELHVRYHLRLLKPTLALVPPAPAGLSGKWTTTGTSAYTNALPLGASPITSDTGNSLTPYMYQLSQNDILELPVIPSARVLVYVSWRGSGGAAFAFTDVFTNCSALTVWNGNANAEDNTPELGVTCQRAAIAYLVDIDAGVAATSGGRPYITFSGMTLPGTPVAVEVVQTVVPLNFAI